MEFKDEKDDKIQVLSAAFDYLTQRDYENFVYDFPDVALEHIKVAKLLKNAKDLPPVDRIT